MKDTPQPQNRRPQASRRCSSEQFDPSITDRRSAERPPSVSTGQSRRDQRTQSPAPRPAMPNAAAQRIAGTGIVPQLNRPAPRGYRAPLTPDGLPQNPAGYSAQRSLRPGETRGGAETQQGSPPKLTRVCVKGQTCAVVLMQSNACGGERSTVSIHAASLSKNPASDRQLDWKQAISLCLAPYEVGMLLSVLTGTSPHCKFVGHGIRHDRWISAIQLPPQEGSDVRLTVGHTGRQIAVDITYLQIVQAIIVVEPVAREVLGLQRLATDVVLRRLSQLYIAAEQSRGTSPIHDDSF